MKPLTSCVKVDMSGDGPFGLLTINTGHKLKLCAQWYIKCTHIKCGKESPINKGYVYAVQTDNLLTPSSLSESVCVILLKGPVGPTGLRGERGQPSLKGDIGLPGSVGFSGEQGERVGKGSIESCSGCMYVLSTVG